MTTDRIHIDRLALGGDGVGRLLTGENQPGKVAFVPYTLPGEEIEGRLLFDKKQFSRWLPLSLLHSSPDRIQSPCPLHFQLGQAEGWCGGCDWQHMSLPYQRSSKSQLVMETLIRLGGVSHPSLNPILGGSRGWRYRNKVQVPFGFRGRSLVAGFYSPGTHEIVDFDDCPVQPAISVNVIHAIKKLAAALDLPPYNEDRHRGWLRHVLVRTNEMGQAMVALVVTHEKFPQKSSFVERLCEACPFVVGIYLNIQPARTHVILGQKWIRLHGQDQLMESVGGLNLVYSPASFFQVNTQAALLLFQEAIRLLAPTPDSVVLDLYCGVGAMSLLAASSSKFSVGVEEAASSIRDAQQNARINHITNVRFIRGRVEQIFRPKSEWGDRLRREENLRVLIDPPRSGCEENLLRGLVRLHPRRIVYVSCNPATLARDVKRLMSHYRFIVATPVDLFPQTSHIETVVQLDRK